MRHPCGQVASILRGIRLGKFQSSVPVTEDHGIIEQHARTHIAKELGFDGDRARSMKPEERLAWFWVISNLAMLTDLRDQPNARIIRYEDLCRDPVPVSKSLFDFAGLDWSAQSHRFISASARSVDSEGYYQVFRDASRSSSKWRNELTPQEIFNVMAVVRGSPLAGMFDEPRPELDLLAS